MIKAAFLANPSMVAKVYGHGRREEIARRVDLLEEIVVPDQLDEQVHLLHEVELIFSTWGMRALTEEQLDRLPNVKVVFYAAGSVQPFARPLLERGVTLVSGWRANAVPVAEFTLAQILLSNKGYFRNVADYQTFPHEAKQAFHGPSNYGETVALLGAGAIGRLLIGMLKPFHLRVIVYDPFLADGDAETLNVEKVSLDAAFERGFVVSNHLPDKAETVGVIHAGLLNRMRPGATFINTGRGKTVNHADLQEALRRRPDLTALLDVTDPEPLSPDSPLFVLPNVHVSTHIAGSLGNEVFRLADYCIEELDRYLGGEPLQHAVTTQMLSSLA